MNWGVIFAALASFIFGWLFYSPVLFGNLWLKYSGISMAEAKKMHAQGMAGKMFIGFVASIVTAWFLLMFMTDFGVSAWDITWKIWLGFLVSTTLIGGVLWENKRIELFFLNAIYWLLNIGIMAWVVTLF